MSAAEAEEAERQRRLDVVAEKQRERDARYDDAKRMERARSARLLRKREEEEAKVARAEEQRRKVRMQTLEKRLTLEEKQEHVEMTARRRQYEAALLLEKIERDTARAKAVNAAKEDGSRRGRLNNDELRLERELLLRADARGSTCQVDQSQAQACLGAAGVGAEPVRRQSLRQSTRERLHEPGTRVDVVVARGEVKRGTKRTYATRERTIHCLVTLLYHTRSTRATSALHPFPGFRSARPRRKSPRAPRAASR